MTRSVPRPRSRLIVAIAFSVVTLAAPACGNDRAAPVQASRPDVPTPRHGATGSPEKKHTPKSDARQAKVPGTRAPTSPGRRARSAGDKPSPSTSPDARHEDDEQTFAIYPTEGSYEYSQFGYEAFCMGGFCDRKALPPTQTVDLDIVPAGNGEAEIRTYTVYSSHRTARTEGRYGKDEGIVTHASMHVKYQGLSIDEAYDPRPPVRVVEFPLRVGKSWSGSWKAGTSGDYEMNVVKEEVVRVAGRKVRAFLVTARIQLQGRFDGEARLKTWIDPRTRVFVKTTEDLKVTSDFGDYETSLTASLSNGPAYE